MTVQQYQLTADFVLSDVEAWYDQATDGDTAVLVRPVAPAVRLIRQPRAHVYWWTEGERGLTVSLADARQRLVMVQERPFPSSMFSRWLGDCWGSVRPWKSP